MNLRLPVLSALILMAAASCKNELSNKSRGPVVLGDSATIVTERDETKLQDGVADLSSATSAGSDAPTPGRDTAHTATAQVPAGAGLTAAFKEVTIMMAGITAREGNKDYGTARGASFTLAGGNLSGSALRTSGGTVSKVSQRYTTVIVLQNASDKLVLEGLSNMSGWQPLQGSSGTYTLSGLDAAKLEYKNAAPAEIRNAVQGAARKQKLSRQDTQDWLDAVKNIRAANQSPATVMLKSISWRIEGKDAAGKAFSKEIRVDIPM